MSRSARMIRHLYTYTHEINEIRASKHEHTKNSKLIRGEGREINAQTAQLEENHRKSTGAT